MKYKKNLGTALFWVLISALLIAPLVLIGQISQREMAEYTAATPPTVTQTAYGAPVQPARVDLYESVTLSGTLVSEAWADLELSASDPSLYRWNIQTGDQITEGQVIATYQGREVIATCSGIVMEINSYNTSNDYVRVQLLHPLALECQVTQQQRRELERARALTLADGTALTLSYVSLQRNWDNTTTVRLSLAEDGDYCYGQGLEQVQVYTGVCYPQTLMLSTDCVYQRTAGETEAWYVRQVTAEGDFIEEVQVTVNGVYGDMVKVTGVAEDGWYDSGARAILGE